MIVPCLCTILIVVILIVVIVVVVVIVIIIIIIVIVVRVGCGCDSVDVVVSSFVIAIKTLIIGVTLALVVLDSDTVDGITHIDLDVL